MEFRDALSKISGHEKQKLITIKMRSGDKEIKAKCIGDFAYHIDYYIDRSVIKKWNITHIPTGLVVEKFISKEKAQNHTAIFDAISHLDDEKHQMLETVVKFLSNDFPLDIDFGEFEFAKQELINLARQEGYDQ